MDGTKGEKPKKFFSCGLCWLKMPVPVKTWDERLTTVAAKVLLDGDVTRKGRKKVIDKLAAVFILENYLRYKSETDR